MICSVVLPAPFGPITPTMPPGGNEFEPLNERAAVEAFLDVIRLQHDAAEPRPGRDLDLRRALPVASSLIGELLIGLDARLALDLPRLRARAIDWSSRCKVRCLASLPRLSCAARFAFCSSQLE